MNHIGRLVDRSVFINTIGKTSANSRGIPPSTTTTTTTSSVYFLTMYHQLPSLHCYQAKLFLGLCGMNPTHHHPITTTTISITSNMWFGSEPASLAAWILDKLGVSYRRCALNILAKGLCGANLLDLVHDKEQFSEALSNVGVTTVRLNLLFHLTVCDQH